MNGNKTINQQVSCIIGIKLGLNRIFDKYISTQSLPKKNANKVKPFYHNFVFGWDRMGYIWSIQGKSESGYNQNSNPDPGIWENKIAGFCRFDYIKQNNDFNAFVPIKSRKIYQHIPR